MIGSPGTLAKALVWSMRCGRRRQRIAGFRKKSKKP
jgi:hypothetical protein